MYLWILILQQTLKTANGIPVLLRPGLPLIPVQGAQMDCRRQLLLGPSAGVQGGIRAAREDVFQLMKAGIGSLWKILP